MNKVISTNNNTALTGIQKPQKVLTGRSVSLVVLLFVGALYL